MIYSKTKFFFIYKDKSSEITTKSFAKESFFYIHNHFFETPSLLLYPKQYFLDYSKNYMSRENDTLSRLMEDAQAGKSESYRKLLNQISIILSKFLNRRVVSVDDRDDVLQEILLAIHNSRHTYIPSKPFYPWMYAIAKNTLIKYYKKIQKQNNNLVEIEISNIASPNYQESNHTERLNEITRLIEELPGKQRQIIQMLKLQGLSIKQVSAKLSLSEANVKVIAHRGYHSIRKKVKK